jgi:hypothetical protein
MPVFDGEVLVARAFAGEGDRRLDVGCRSTCAIRDRVAAEQAVAGGEAMIDAAWAKCSSVGCVSVN